VLDRIRKTSHDVMEGAIICAALLEMVLSMVLETEVMIIEVDLIWPDANDSSWS
jgi:hypothetical protein